MRWNADLFARALDFAAARHRDQRVPGSGFPYVVHITKVALEVLHAVGDDPTLDVDLTMVCALLHDTLEDTGLTKAALAEAFGERVADGVDALTKDPKLPKAERMADALRRIRQQPREIWLVKLADRITNLEPPPPDWPLEKRQHYLREAGEILTALGSAHPGLDARFSQRMRAYEAHCR